MNVMENEILESHCKVCLSKNCIEDLFKEKNCVVCKKCDAIYSVNPIVHKKRVNEESEILGDIIKKMGIKIISGRYRDIIAEQYIKYLKKKTIFKFNHVLDVGAHFGNLVKKFNENGIAAEGLEASDEYKKFTVTDKITYGYFDENFLVEKKYDLISFTNMLYYLKNPISTLEYAKKCLTKSGMIFISTYNTNSSIFRQNNKFFEPSYNIVQSRKNFETINDFKLIDYTTYDSEMITNAVNKTNYSDILKNYFKFYFKKSFKENNNGHQAFILLKPV